MDVMSYRADARQVEAAQGAAEGEAAARPPLVRMATQETTPDFLRARTQSAHLTALGWKADRAKVKPPLNTMREQQREYGIIVLIPKRFTLNARTDAGAGSAGADCARAHQHECLRQSPAVAPPLIS